MRANPSFQPRDGRLAADGTWTVHPGPAQRDGADERGPPPTPEEVSRALDAARRALFSMDGSLRTGPARRAD